MRDPRTIKPSPRRTETKNLTLGELIARTYRAGGKKRALNILQLAMEAQIIKFLGHKG